MSEPTPFRALMSLVRIHADAADDLYSRMVSGEDVSSELGTAIHAGVHALVQASQRAMTDRRSLEAFASGEFSLSDADVLAAVAADEAEDPSQPMIPADPDREAHCVRDIEAGDLLAAPPAGDVEVPGSLWAETEALHYRDQHPFPIDPDEEKPW